MPKKTTTTTDGALRRLQAAREAAETLTNAERELRQRHKELTKERRKTEHAPPSEAEVLASMEAVVDRAAAAWRERVAGAVVRQTGGHWTSRGEGDTRERWLPPSLPVFGAGRELSLEDLAGLTPNAVKASLAATIRGYGAERFGLPADQRRERIEELDREIGETEEQHTTLVDGAAEVGIELALLDDVARRREQKREAEDRAGVLERQRRDAEARGETFNPPTTVRL